MEKRIGFHLNQQYCMGCKTCQIACKDKHDNGVGVNFRRVEEHSGGEIEKKGEAFHPRVWAYWIPQSCNHCDAPKCVEVCPTGAASKRASDGTVLIEAAACIGCELCTKACPYGAPQFDPQRSKAGKCDLCADYRARGKDPACVSACPMRVIEWGSVDDLKAGHPQALRRLQGLPDPAVTGPNTLYTPHRHAALRPGGEG